MFPFRASPDRGVENRGAMRVLGIDPGLRNLGWGVIDVMGARLTHVANGICHSTPGDDSDLASRLLSLFDQFRGAGVPAGQRSLAWRLTLRHPERTLRDKEVEGRREKLLRTLESELGIRQRS